METNLPLLVTMPTNGVFNELLWIFSKIICCGIGKFAAFRISATLCTIPQSDTSRTDVMIRTWPPFRREGAYVAALPSCSSGV